MEQKKYTSEDINLIVLEHEWVICIAENEMDGLPYHGIDTWLVQAEEEADYFGAFVGNERDGYIFEFYTC